MKRQRIGTSGMTASRVALGVMRMDALDAEQSKAVVSQALESDVDFFDTADIYGFSAHRVHASSEAFGAAWTSVGVARRDIFIQTKFGIVRSDDNRDGLRYDYSAEHLLASLDRELEALRTDLGGLFDRRRDIRAEAVNNNAYWKFHGSTVLKTYFLQGNDNK